METITHKSVNSVDWLTALGRVTAQRRKLASMTLETLAATAAMTKSQLQDFEAGQTDISVSELNQIADALQVRASSLTAEADLEFKKMR